MQEQNLPSPVTPESAHNVAESERGLPSSSTGERAEPTQEVVAPKGEASSGGAPRSVGITNTQPLQQPIDPAPVQDDSYQKTSDDDNTPAVADDVDVLEKVWVEKAKAIVKENKHDPYTQEEKANKLQASYLKKRYGKEVATSA